MKAAIIAITLLVAGALASPARAGTSEDVRTLYNTFAAAQNAHDLKMVESLFLDSPKFLWVSDGLSIWGREATLKRMALFQEAETWRVEPALEKATVVEVCGDTAFYHLPLDLVFGQKGAAPAKFKFLVSMLCIRTAEGWRIAALFTTTQNPKADGNGS
ncbi:MAG: nuclear transport factor 2 family protein [Proteobacteria bacterium]|nr:nuclear transport factor 2 family protein [Pseudomonadota bacterium]